MLSPRDGRETGTWVAMLGRAWMRPGSRGACEEGSLKHNAAEPLGVIGVVITPAQGHQAPKGLAPSFEEFFEGSYPSVARALVLLVGDEMEAEELAEESFARAWERWERIRTMSSPAGFVYRTALNLNRSRLRRLALARRRAARTTNVPDPASEVEDRVEVRRILGTLPVAQREALLLVEWLGMDAEEAARVIGIKPVSVRARLHRARTTLRRRLGDPDE